MARSVAQDGMFSESGVRRRSPVYAQMRSVSHVVHPFYSFEAAGDGLLSSIVGNDKKDQAGV